MPHPIARRLDRLETARPDTHVDDRRLVLRAFTGDAKAMLAIGPRLRRAMGLPDCATREHPPPSGYRLDPAALPRTDPSLAAAIRALPAAVKANAIARAEEQHGVTIRHLAARVGIDLGPGTGTQPDHPRPGTAG
ncbi:MAG: hypothetical protein AB7K52_15640 [Phycisphaerales bacterium]